MSRYLFTACVVSTAAAVFVRPGAAAEPSQKEDKAQVNALKLEVAALQTIRNLRLTRSQLEALRELSKDTPQKMGDREPPTASSGYIQVLGDLREALGKGDDEDRITELETKLEDMDDKENPEFDDAVTVTDAARRVAPQVLRLLSAGQIVTWLNDYGGDFTDPLETLTEALDDVRDLKPAELQEQSEEVAEEVASLLAGVDTEKAARVKEQVVALLKRAHGMKAKEFKDKRVELEKAAQKLVGETPPLEIVRNYLEHTLAELLSNPRLPMTLSACLKR